MKRALWLVLAATACSGARGPVAPDGPSRHVRLHVRSADCPVGYLHAAVPGHGGSSIESTQDGVFDLQLQDTATEVTVYACGRIGKVHVNGWEALDVTWELPPRSPKWPPLVSQPWQRAAPAPAPPPPCRIEGTGRLAAGAIHGVQRDEPGCGIRFVREGATWLVRPDRSVIRLGTRVEGANESRYLVADAGATLVSVDRTTGARTVVAQDLHGSFSPRTNVVLLRGDDHGSLALQVLGRAIRPLTEHAGDAVWNDEGTRLAYLDETASAECPTLHVVEPAGADRIGPRLCTISGWGAPRFFAEHVVFFASDAEAHVVDAGTGKTIVHYPSTLGLTLWRHGLLVAAGPSHSELRDFRAGTTRLLPYAFVSVQDLPSGDLLGWRAVREFEGQDSLQSLHDAIFVDVNAGTVTAVAEGVDARAVVSPGGLLVFTEQERLVARRIGSARSYGLPSSGGIPVSVTDDEKWVLVQSPLRKGRPLWTGRVASDGQHPFEVDGDPFVDEGAVVPARRSGVADFDEGQYAYAVDGDGLYLGLRSSGKVAPR